MTTTQPIYSPIIFIGREQEMSVMKELFHADIDDPDAKWILSVHGQGGIGKTQLLYQFAKAATSHHLSEDHLSEDHLSEDHHTVMVTRYPIDLYSTSNQTEAGILKNLADQLSQDHFQEFYTTLYGDYQRSGNEDELRAVFLECYSKLNADHIVLLFDTIERASDAAKRFCSEVFPKLKRGGQGKFGTLIVTAGRRSLTDFWTDHSIQDYELQGLSKAEIQQYFQTLSRGHQSLSLTPEFVDRVAVLSKGRPILIALTIDWLNYGNLPADFVAQTPETFEQLMVEQVKELRQPEDQSILAMAHLNRRFDDGFLQVILGFSKQQAQATIQSLAQFSFVKTHHTVEGNIDCCLLHDEMQRLIMSYVWNHYDPNGDLKQEWSAKAVDYYDELIARNSASEQNLSLCQMLQRERLFYWLQADLEGGLNYWRHLYIKAQFPYEKEALNEELQIVEHKLTPEHKLELKFRQAQTAYERRDYPAALRVFATVLEQSSDIALKAEIYPMMIYCLIHLGDVDQSLSVGTECEGWFRQELDHSALSADVQSKLQHGYGKTLNAIGFAHRNQGRYEQAIAYYQQSLDILDKLLETDADRASTKTNLAYLFHAMGRDREALAHGKTALKIAERFGNFKQLGLTHNVLGIISANSLREQQAINHFHLAFHYFEETEDLRGLALAKIAVGRMFRQIGWSKVKPDRHEFGPAASNYERAAKLFDEAIAHIRYSNRSILIDAYNEKATLLREQGCFDEAIALYQSSLEIAESIGSPLKVADDLLGLGVTYELQNNLNDALRVAQKAIDIAMAQKSPYLCSRAQRIIANVLFKQGDYERAIESAIDSCIKVLEPDLHSFKNSPAKREVLHEEWLTWLTEDLIQQLPDFTVKKEKCQYLIRRWESAAVVGRALADHYPGFVITLEDLITDTDKHL